MANSSVITAKRNAPFVRPILYLALGGVIAWSATAAWQTWRQTTAAAETKSTLPQMYGLSNGVHKGLAPQFSSTDGLTAAAPTDPAKLVDPTTLNIAYVESDEKDAAKIPWEQFAAQIAAATGKKVTTHQFEADRTEMEVIKGGDYQILVVHAAETPFLVNNVGFVPFAVAGDEHGPDGHRLNIIVNANSPMKTVQDIRGQQLLCTTTGSITGYRAALAYLAQNYGLRAGQDYQVIYSGGPTKSVRSIMAGSMDAAAVSNDKLISMTAKGTISPANYRVLFASEVIPRFAVGTMYNLKPEVADKVKKAVLSFVDAPDAGGRTIRFVPVEYGKDFAIARAMDDAFESRALAGPKRATTAAGTQAAPVDPEN